MCKSRHAEIPSTHLNKSRALSSVSGLYPVQRYNRSSKASRRTHSGIPRVPETFLELRKTGGAGSSRIPLTDCRWEDLRRGTECSGEWNAGGSLGTRCVLGWVWTGASERPKKRLGVLCARTGFDAAERRGERQSILSQAEALIQVWMVVSNLLESH